MGSDSGGNVETAEGLTREAENIGSEAYAQKRETLEEEWQKCYGVLEEKYLQLNPFICGGLFLWGVIIKLFSCDVH